MAGIFVVDHLQIVRHHCRVAHHILQLGGGQVAQTHAAHQSVCLAAAELLACEMGMIGAVWLGNQSH